MAGDGDGAGESGWSRFLAEAREFVSVSRELGDGWMLRTFEKDVVGGIGLVKSVIRTLNPPLSRSGKQPGSTSADESEVVNFEYQVLYSESYEIPVLYFKAVRRDGSYLEIERIWSNIPTTSVVQAEADPDDQRFTYKQFGDVITQMEHPFQGLPFFYLHPCHTAELVAQVSAGLPSGHSHLLTWISTAAPLVGLTIDPAFAQRLTQRQSL